jgi:uncharacterized protein (TIGR03067 family)
MVATDLVEVQSIAPPRTSTFKVIPGEPMALDMTTINHTDQSLMYTKAIYRLKGQVLIYCVGAPGKDRPTDFTTATGDGNTLVVLRRSTAQP